MMIEIKKRNQPSYLKKYPKDALFEDLSSEDKELLRSDLLKEQGYLCAYCMKRIHDAKDTKIEHYEPRNETNQLDYSNLLIVCRGNERSPYHRTTCDTRKRNLRLSIDPKKRAHIDTITYTSNGIIKSTHPDYDDDLNRILNLNDDFGYLKSNRERVLKDFQVRLHQFGPANKGIVPYLQKYKRSLERLNESGMYTEYVGILLHYIDKCLKKHNK